ncbi:MAG: YedE family putative selenium transporter [Nitrospirota bacterium]
MIEFIRKHKEILTAAAAGVAMGWAGACLACLGNPKNTGICISCFMENLAGSIGLHNNVRMQYIRPELIGFVLGGMAAAMIAKEFKAEGGSSPMLRFFAGVLLIVGCSIFLGCPIRMILRLANGDFTAISAVIGLIVGVWIGLQFLKRGFYLGDIMPMPFINGVVIPVIFALLFLGLMLKPGFLHFSTVGPAAQDAHIKFSLGSGLIIGFLAQRSRFCITGSIGNFMASRDKKVIVALVAFALTALAVNLYKGFFTPGFDGQPGSHLSYGWSFMGMMLVGIVSAMIGGCPFRQLILAGQGSTDAGAAVLGMVAGGAIVQAWDITSSNMGPTVYGEVATLAGISLVFVAGLFLRVRE